MGIPENMAELLAPVVSNLGVELVDVEHNGAVLRVVVDQDGGIDTDTLAKVNRLISPMLDEADPIGDRYTLEVSSPGVERKLRTIEHFGRSIGETVVLKLIPSQEIRRIKGKLTSVAETSVTVLATEVEGVALEEPQIYVIEHLNVLKAKTAFDWKTSSKSGRSKNAKKSKNKNKNGNTGQPVSPDKTNKQGSDQAIPGTQDKGTL